MFTDSIMQSLEEIAYQKTVPFCYTCYTAAPTGRCSKCGSDDLMRLLEDYGVEYGVEWAIPALLEESVTALDEEDLQQRFNEELDELCPEVEIGYCTLSPSEILRECRPGDYDLQFSDWLDSEVEVEALIEIGGRYYESYCVEDYVKEEL